MTRRTARGQSQTERDVEGFAARKERDAATLPEEQAFDDITGKHEGAELALLRAGRPLEDRINRLESKGDEIRQDARERYDEIKQDMRDLKQDARDKHDELKQSVAEVRSDMKGLTSQVGEMRADVSGATAKLGTQDKMLSEVLSIVKKTAEREHVTFTAKVEVDKERELAQVAVDKERALVEVIVDKAHVDVEKERALALVGVEKERELDKFAARRARRKLILKVMGLLASGGVVIELLHRIGVL